MSQKTMADLFEGQLERVGRILADRYDIQIQYEGEMCRTDGRKIILPAIARQEEHLTQKTVAMLNGYLDHEVGHLLFSDWRVLASAYGDELTSNFLQAIEDIRQEAHMGDLWKGSKSILRDTRHEVFKFHIARWGMKDLLPKVIISLLMMGSKDQEAMDMVPDQELFKRLAPLQAALDLVPKLPTTLHSLGMTQYIMGALGLEAKISDPQLQQEAFEQQKQIEQEVLEALAQMMGSAGSGEEGQSGEGAGESTAGSESGGEGAGGSESGGEGAGGEGEGGEGAGGEGAGKPGGGPSGKGEAPGGGKEAPDGEGLPSPGEEAAKEAAAKEALQSLPKLHPGKGGSGQPSDPLKEMIEHEMPSAVGKGKPRVTDPDYYLPWSTKGDVVKIMENPGKYGRDWYMETLEKVKQITGVMVRKLRMAFENKTKHRMSRGFLSGQLSPPDLPKFLVTGDPHVFRRHTVQQIMRTRISLLVDLSGSMRGGKLEEAKKAIIVWGECLDIMDIPFEILGFTSVSFETERENYAKASEEEHKRFTRWGELKIELYKQFSESWKKVRYRIYGMKAQNHNYDGEAVMYAARRLKLAAKADERTILFVFSDGLPEQDIHTYQPNIRRHLSNVLKRIEAAGVETIGIGLKTRSVEDYYRNHVVLQEMERLAETELTKLKEVLLEGRNHKSRPKELAGQK